MKNKIAFNRAYVKGLNTIKGSGYSLNALKSGLVSLSDTHDIPKHKMDILYASIGQLERFHAPKEIPLNITNSEAWIGSACCSYGEQWEQWIQIASIPRSKVPTSTSEKETIEEQVVMSGSDRKRIHIEWGSGRKEGFIHAHTSRYMSTDDFLDTSPMPPSCIMTLPPGYLSMYGWTIQTGNLYDNVDDSFRWYDDEITRRWYRTLVYKIEGMTYVCMLDASHLRDALSGFDADHFITISEQQDVEIGDGMHILKGSIRIDGTYNGKRRTSVLMTAKIDEDRILTLMGVV